MTREIGPELVARIRHVADSLEAIVRGEVDSPQPFIDAYAVYLNGEYDSSYGPDAIDEALEIAADCNGDVVPLYRTPPTHAAPGKCSAPRSYEKSDEKRVLSDMKSEPLAWAVIFGREHEIVYEVTTRREVANEYLQDVIAGRVVPLYRRPTLTENEIDALYWAMAQAEKLRDSGKKYATLRSLLQRLGGTDE